MRDLDKVMLALTIWRENRGGGREGMQSVANVILNRAAKKGTSAYTECVRPMQFSSVTAPGDPELVLWPIDSDPAFAVALGIADRAAAGALEDLTDGALLYYAPKSIKSIKSSKTIVWMDGKRVPFPESWNANAVTPLCSIAGHLFFR